MCPDDGPTRGAGDNRSMKQIHQDTYEAIQKTHPIEAAIWTMWIQTGEARVLPSPTWKAGSC